MNTLEYFLVIATNVFGHNRVDGTVHPPYMLMSLEYLLYSTLSYCSDRKAVIYRARWPKGVFDNDGIDDDLFRLPFVPKRGVNL